MVVSNKIRAIIAFAAIAASVGIITQLLISNFTEKQTQIQNQEATHSSQQYVPPPMPLTKLWGPQVASFDQATSITNLSKISLPSYMPAELSIGSIRASGNSIGVDLIPKNMTAQENDTIQQVLGSGGIIIIYSQEPNPSRVNETAWMHNFVNQSPQTTHLDEINGHPSIIWNAQKNGVVILRSDIMVDIESVKYDSTELKKIAQSILP